jgi:hypothetical protein
MLAIIALLIALVIPSHAFAQDTGGTKFRGISVNMTADDFKAAWPGWREACPPLYAQAPALVAATQTVAQIIKKELDAVRDKIKGLQEKARIQELKNLEASLEEILEEQRIKLTGKGECRLLNGKHEWCGIVIFDAANKLSAMTLYPCFFELADDVTLKEFEQQMIDHYPIHYFEYDTERKAYFGTFATGERATLSDAAMTMPWAYCPKTMTGGTYCLHSIELEVVRTTKGKF